MVGRLDVELSHVGEVVAYQVVRLTENDILMLAVRCVYLCRWWRATREYKDRASG